MSLLLTNPKKVRNSLKDLEELVACFDTRLTLPQWLMTLKMNILVIEHECIIKIKIFVKFWVLESMKNSMEHFNMTLPNLHTRHCQHLFILIIGDSLVLVRGLKRRTLNYLIPGIISFQYRKVVTKS